MRKLFAGFIVVAAIVAFYFLAIKPIEDESQSQHHQQQIQSKKHKQPQLPMYRAPKVDGRTFNLEVVWWKSGKNQFFPESVAWTRHDIVNKPGQAHLIVTSKGIRIKLSSPKAKVVKVRLWYAPGHTAPKCFSWNGKGVMPLTKPITTKEGKEIRANLVEISLAAYDPRFLGPHIKPHIYPGVVNIPPGMTEVG